MTASVTVVRAAVAALSRHYAMITGVIVCVFATGVVLPWWLASMCRHRRVPCVSSESLNNRGDVV